MNSKRTIEHYKMIEKLGKSNQLLDDINELSTRSNLTILQAAELVQIETDLKRICASMRRHIESVN